MLTATACIYTLTPYTSIPTPTTPTPIALPCPFFVHRGPHKTLRRVYRRSDLFIPYKLTRPRTGVIVVVVLAQCPLNWLNLQRRRIGDGNEFRRTRFVTALTRDYLVIYDVNFSYSSKINVTEKVLFWRLVLLTIYTLRRNISTRVVGSKQCVFAP